jgi:hypothetical protein
MLISWPMVVAGLLTGIGCLFAHRRMRKRTYLTPIPRYTIGVALALIPWTVALIIEPGATTIETVALAIVGVWTAFGAGVFGTWIGYEEDRKEPTEADVENLARYITGEHDAPAGSDQD